jgi:anti-sigma factor RsiW
MSCSRVSRELLERFRFGETLDGRSDRHLEHLQVCHACREVVGLDLALVANLRRALRARVAGNEPSPGSWEVVRRRALGESPRLTWPQQLMRWTRFVPAGAVLTVMVFAVATSREASPPQLAYDRNWTAFQRLADTGDAWQMPWWLRERAPSPPPPPTHGILALAVPDVEAVPAPARVSGPLE